MDETTRRPDQWQQPLPFDDEADRPVPFALTARARRAVAPAEVPDLSVVRPVEDGPEDGAVDDPGDTRPARARALRRAGTPVARIARVLEVDELVVRAWLGDLAGRGAAGRTVALVPTDRGEARGARVFEQARAQAQATAADRLAGDAAFAAGLGLVTGIADVDEHSVSVRSDDPRVAATVVRWLLASTAAAPARFRVVLRLHPEAAADLARHRWAEALRLPVEQVAHTRTREARPGAEEALVRIADPAVAGTVSGWAQALLEPTSPEPVDAAF